jgi:hypothetical protein
MVVLDPTHPSTQGLPARWHVADEVYNFNHDPRRLGAVVVLSVDETSYRDDGDHSPTQGSPHPIGTSQVSFHKFHHCGSILVEQLGTWTSSRAPIQQDLSAEVGTPV